MIRKVRFVVMALACILFGFNSGDVWAQKKVPTAEQMLNNTAQGKEFWIAFPGNDDPQQPSNALEIYVTSSFDTDVTLEFPGLGFQRTLKLKALEVITFSTNDQTATWGFEFWESEKVLDHGVRISAGQPISVYALNGKTFTSEGYLGLPVNVWGTSYIHCSYYDFREVRAWKSGFCVIAAEDATEISITLRGKGNAKTVGGKRLGQTWKTTLRRGQVYPVMGDGTTIGEFDLTGTRVTSNKKVGFISFHQRVIVPYNAGNGRDYLIEMMPPTSAWGKKFMTLEFNRDNKGDFFRIVASRDNTKWNMTFYDKKTGETLGNRNGVLAKAGDFYEDFNYWIGRGQIEGFRGVAVWEADQPVLLMQYSYSANWDNSDEFDPFMIVQTPLEQYLKATVFQTPANKAFNKNWLGIIAEGDPDDPEMRKLKSIAIDGDTLHKIDPKILFQRIPGTKYYWTYKQMQPGPHRITSNTLFGGYIYGFSNFDSYGWPAAMAFRKTDEFDTVPPKLNKTIECGDYLYTGTERVIDPRYGSSETPGGDTLQNDTGIIQIELDETKSFNYELELLSPKELIRDPRVREARWRVKVKDKKSDAYAILMVMDQADNVTFDTLYYYADQIELDPKIVHFGSVRLGTTKELTVNVKNVGNGVVKLKKIELQNKIAYTIIAGAVPPEIELAPGAMHQLTIEFKPTKEGLTLQDPDLEIDSLIVGTECADFDYPVKGRGVRPCIVTEPIWDAGAVVVNSKLCKTQQTGRGLRVQNKGTDTLTLTGVTGVRLPFSSTIVFPVKIPPRGEVFLSLICFEPSDLDPDSINVVLESDSQGDDCNPNSFWKGRGRAPGPVISDYDWSERRVLTINGEGVLYIKNLGTSDVTLVGVALSDAANPNFKILGTQPGNISTGNPIVLRSNGANEVTVQVEYTPQSEAAHANTVVPVFLEQVPPIAGKLDGIGILPKIIVTGWAYPEICIGEELVDGYIEIVNPSTSADLQVYSIAVKAGVGQSTDFNFIAPPPQDFIVQRNNGKSVLPVRFSPTDAGKRHIAIEIMSDAATGPEVNPRIEDTVHVSGRGLVCNPTESDPRVTSLNFGAKILCDNPVGTIQISNVGTGPLTVTGLDISGDLAAFTLTEPTFPIVIPANSAPVTIPVAFNLAAMTMPATYRIDVVVLDDSPKDDVISVIQGSTFNVPSTFSLSPNKTTTPPGKPIQVNLIAESPNWRDAAVDSWKATLRYNSKMMKFNAFTPAPNWTLNTQPIETLTGETAEVTIDVNGNIPIGADGSLGQFNLDVLLGDSLQFTMNLSMDLNDRNKCVLNETKPAFVELEGCFINGRLLDATGVGYAMSATPNPVQGSAEVVVSYSVGLKAQTHFEFVNMSGETIQSINVGSLDPGFYELKLPSSRFESGSYIIRMKSGLFVADEQIIISK